MRTSGASSSAAWRRREGEGKQIRKNNFRLLLQNIIIFLGFSCIKIFPLAFCLRRSPDHGTVRVVGVRGVGVGVVTIFILNFFEVRKSLKNKICRHQWCNKLCKNLEPCDPHGVQKWAKSIFNFFSTQRCQVRLRPPNPVKNNCASSVNTKNKKHVAGTERPIWPRYRSQRRKKLKNDGIKNKLRTDLKNREK